MRVTDEMVLELKCALAEHGTTGRGLRAGLEAALAVAPEPGDLLTVEERRWVEVARDRRTHGLLIDELLAILDRLAPKP